MKCQVQKDKYQTWVLDPAVLNKECVEKSSSKRSKSHLKSVYDAMFEPCEYAAAFQISHSLKRVCDSNACKNVSDVSMNLESINRGDSASVKTEHGLCNFHTHPVTCYLQEVTAWGWPSGEDIRESIRFMLAGNVIHFVFTMEGIYGIEVNPLYLHALQDLPNDLHRGIVISMIESYFKATHGFRNIDYLTQSKNTFCTPNDWVNFVNNFRLDNMVASGKNRCSKGLSCDGFPDSQSKSKTLSFSEYLNNYELDAYSMDIVGKLKRSNHKEFESMAQEKLSFLIRHFESYTKSQQGYAKGQWFRCTLYENEFMIDGKQLTLTQWLRKLNNDSGKSSAKAAKSIHAFWKHVLQQHQQHPDKKLFRFYPHVIKFKGYAITPRNGQSCQIK